MHEDDMERFVEEQRVKLAEERRNLDMNPSSAVSAYYNDPRSKEVNNNVPANQVQKAFVENSPPVPVNTRPETPKIFKLGEDYKKFRNYLNQERQQDYLNQLNKRRQQGQPPQAEVTPPNRPELVKQTSDLGLSLPIRDHPSAQERLRRERNREYNELLQRGRGRNNQSRVAPAPQPAELPAQPVRTQATKIFLPELPTNQQLEPGDTTDDNDQKRLEADEYAAARKREADEYVRAKKRDAESYQELLDRKRLEERLYRNEDDYLPPSQPGRGPPPVEYVPVRRRPIRRRPPPRSYYEDDLYDDDYYDALDEELYLRSLKNIRRPRIIRHIVDDDVDSERTRTPTNQPHVAKVGSRRDRGRSDKRQLNSAESSEERLKRNQQQQNINTTTGGDIKYDTPGEVRSKSAPPEQQEKFTGLPIGERENYSSNQKKEQYRRELEQQMREKEEQKRANKLRDRSGERTSDREDKPKRVTYADEAQTRRRRSDSEGDNRPPPRPILNNNPPATSRQYRTPPPVQSTDIISPNDQAYFYYGQRNPFDPSFNQVGPTAALPPTTATSYPPMNTPLQANTQPSNLRSSGGGITPNAKTSEFVIKSLNGQTGLFLADGTQDTSKQLKQASYQDELRRQMEEKKREKEMRKAEQERYDRRKDAEAREYNPWGKGGGGAPMRDLQGNLVSDLRQMRQTNDDISKSPSKIQQQQKPSISTAVSPRYNNTNNNNNNLNESTDLGNTPRFGRSNPFENKETAQQKSQKDLYKEELQRQIDERKRVEAERKERLRIEEEKEEKRLQEQNKKMQEEFEAEQKRKQEKIEEQKRKNEELQRQIEEQRKAEEEKRKQKESSREDELRRQKEKELDEKFKQASPRNPQASVRLSSQKPVIAEGEKIPRTPVGRPPVSTRPLPSNRSNRPPQTTQRTARLDTVRNSQRIPTSRTNKIRYDTEEDRDYIPPSNQVTSRRGDTPRYIYSRDSSRISRELSALRRQLLEEQRRIENQLGTEDSDLNLRNNQIQDLSRLRQRPVQVVRRPVPLPRLDNPDEMALKEFNNFKYGQEETPALRIFKSEFPEQPVDSQQLERQQAELIKTQVQNLENLKSPSQSVQPVIINNITAAPQRQSQPITSTRYQAPLPQPTVPQQVPASPADSLLETETTYIPISDTLPPTPQLKRPARERRRAERDKENNAASNNGAEINSMTISDVELLAGKNQRRLTQLQDSLPITKPNTAAGADSVLSGLSDPDDILNQFVSNQSDSGVNVSSQNKQKTRRSESVNTLESEPWLRPESRTT